MHNCHLDGFDGSLVRAYDMCSTYLYNQIVPIGYRFGVDVLEIFFFKVYEKIMEIIRCLFFENYYNDRRKKRI